MRKFFKWFAFVLLIIVVTIAIIFFNNLKDRNPGYTIHLNIKPTASNTLKAGFSACSITPELPDRWKDINQNAKYDPKDGDTYIDGNGNGIFDVIWMAGFDKKRAANGIHDDLWARTMVIDDGATRISFTVIDAIGLFHDEVIDIRNQIKDKAGITYSIVSSTHTHQAPDLMGLWGPTYLKSGINEDYLQFVISQIVESIVLAEQNLQPVKIKFAQDLNSLSSLVTDTRKPYKMDEGLRIIQFSHTGSQKTIGTLISWANHPETLWSENLMITSDFPHYVREGIERGIFKGDSLILPGLGGIAIYLNGAIGGHMTTHPDFRINDPWNEETYLIPSFEKARSQGMQLANVALKALEQSTDTISKAKIGVVARTIELPLQNPLFRIGAALGTLNRGFSKWGYIRTEIAYITFGPASFLTYPGEVFPELINGGMESPAGQDFNIPPVELPVARDMMKGKYKYIIGLGNDELGYVIPKSEWDDEPPYLYDEKESPYGEINSLGPDISPLLHKEIMQMLKDFNN
jgi:hypothetical protein